jgi:hypothetical protein
MIDSREYFCGCGLFGTEMGLAWWNYRSSEVISCCVWLEGWCFHVFCSPLRW